MIFLPTPIDKTSITNLYVHSCERAPSILPSSETGPSAAYAKTKVNLVRVRRTSAGNSASSAPEVSTNIPIVNVRESNYSLAEGFMHRQIHSRSIDLERTWEK